MVSPASKKQALGVLRVSTRWLGGSSGRGGWRAIGVGVAVAVGSRENTTGESEVYWPEGAKGSYRRQFFLLTRSAQG